MERYKAYKYERWVSKLKGLCPFAATTCVDIIDAVGNTAYTPNQFTGSGSIVIYLDSLYEGYKSNRYKKRFGKVTFNRLVALTLLHEACHIKQFEDLGVEKFTKYVLKINDRHSHDTNLLEIQADEFAKLNIRKFEKKLGITLS